MKVLSNDGDRVLVRPTDVVVAPFLEARRTRNAHSPRDLAALAAWYVVRVENGDRNPAATLAALYPETSVKTWANILNKARNLGLLTQPPRRGRAGGELTDDAWDLLVSHNGMTDDEDDHVNEELMHGPNPAHGLRDGRVLTDSELTDAIADEHRSAWDRAVGLVSPEETSRAREGGYLPELLAQAKRRRTEHETRTRAFNLSQISRSTTVEELKKLWLTGRDVLEADDELMAAWRARGRALEGPPGAAPNP